MIYIIASFLVAHLLDEAKAHYSGTSLRYYHGISGSVYEQGATMWTEEFATVQGGTREVDTTVITYLGDGSLAYSTKFMAGGYPITEEIDSCAISDTLAFALFGSVDVVGLELLFEEKTYRIKGIFANEEYMALVTGDVIDQYTVVELVEGENIDTFLMPSVIIYGRDMVGLLVVASNLPLAFLGLIACFYGIRLLRKQYPFLKEWGWLLILFIVAISIPTLLHYAPSWVLPTRWSDFGFWSTLLERMNIRVEEWFYLQPTWKDVRIKEIILQVILLLILEVIAMWRITVHYMDMH